VRWAFLRAALRRCADLPRMLSNVLPVSSRTAPNAYDDRRGNTDNVPIHTTLFHSNWELSTARAMELIRVFYRSSIRWRPGDWGGRLRRVPSDLIRIKLQKAAGTIAVWISWFSLHHPVIVSYKDGGEIKQASARKAPAEKKTERLPPQTNKVSRSGFV